MANVIETTPIAVGTSSAAATCPAVKPSVTSPRMPSTRCETGLMLAMAL